MAIDLVCDTPYFQLTNSQRVCVGLIPVKQEWEWMRTPLEGRENRKCWVCFDGDILRKVLMVGPETYIESEMEEQTLEGRTKILPRNGQGKFRPLSFADLERRPLGMHLHYDRPQHQFYIEHMESGRTYYSASLDTKMPTDLKEFADWARHWEAETTPTNMEELAALLCLQKRQKMPYREGDFFRYPLGRRQFGYGRILLDYNKQRKRKEPFWDILKGVSQRPLLVMPYRIISNDPALAVEELRQLPVMPSFYMEDYHIALGDYPIVRHWPLEADELDFPIHYGRSIPWQKGPKIIFQCGNIFLELEGAEPLPHCDHFRSWDVAQEIFTSRYSLEHCIADGNNSRYWTEQGYDLRSPVFHPNLEAVCQQMSLDIKKLPAKFDI